MVGPFSPGQNKTISGIRNLCVMFLLSTASFTRLKLGRNESWFREIWTLKVFFENGDFFLLCTKMIQNDKN